MKKGKTIITALALSTATALYAGNGMGGGMPCGYQGEGKCAKKQTPSDCGGQGMHRGAKAMKRHAKGRHGRMERMMQRIQQQLDLTPEQQKKIQGIMAEYRQQMQNLRQKRRGQQGMGRGMGQGMQAQGMKAQGMQGQGKGMKRGMPLASVLGAEKFDKAAFAKMMEARWAKQDARRMERRRVILEHLSAAMEKIHGVLTPEQRKKLLELSQQKAR